jgi:hypothetical protein
MGRKTIHSSPRKKGLVQVKTAGRRKTRGGRYLYELAELSEDSDTVDVTPAPKKKRLNPTLLKTAFEEGTFDTVPEDPVPCSKKAPGVVSLPSTNMM